LEPLLYLTHRIPFPPNKGDKVRSFHLLKFLASHASVHVGTFIDDPADVEHVPALGAHCASLKAVRIDPHGARLRSMAALFTREALSVRYYRNREMTDWVADVVARHGIRNAVVFSSSMAQFAMSLPDVRTVVDFVDVDSAKWESYGRARPWPLSAIYAREGARLREYERDVSLATDTSVFVTRAEADLFLARAPECAARVRAAQNGVDANYFSPDPMRASPYGAGVVPLVFTGAMDYWPNVDAVAWFAQDVLPQLREAVPALQFYIVGMQPSPTVKALARLGGVVVTGCVPDVRPYLQHARAVVAPLRVARGIQNKVLEAMAMGCAVVASRCAAAGLTARAGVDFAVSAEESAPFTAAVLDALQPERAIAFGRAGRARVLADYDWNTNLAPFAEFLASAAVTNDERGLARRSHAQ